MAVVDEKIIETSEPSEKPWEIESPEEKNHCLNRIPQVEEMLKEIRLAHIDTRLFTAKALVDDLAMFIEQKYSNELENFNTHPRIMDIRREAKQMEEMMDFMTSQGDWKTYKNDGQWKTEYISYPSGFNSYRVSGLAKCQIFNLAAVIYEMDLMRLWMPLAKESSLIGDLSKACRIGCVTTGFWLLQDRQCVLYGFGVDDLEQNGRVLIYFDSKTDHTNIKRYNIQIPPVPAKTVRVEVKVGGFLFEKVDANTTKMTVCWNIDPKMIVPTAIINWFTGVFAGTLLGTIVKASQFKEDSPHGRRVKNNEYFYGDMKRRLEFVKDKHISPESLKNESSKASSYFSFFSRKSSC